MQELSDLLERHGFGGVSLQMLLQASDTDIYGFVVPGEDALDIWRRLRGIVEDTGHWPLLLGDIDSLDRLGDAWDSEDESFSAREIVDKGVLLDVDAWLVERVEEDPEGYDFPGVEASEPPSAGGSDNSDALVNLPEELYVALVPTQFGWETPAYLRFGGWNDCPDAEVHVALARRWQQRYAAEVVAIESDVIRFLVAQPPSDYNASFALAREQAIYCPDLVYQGADTLDQLTNYLIGRSFWTFWWD